jgi:NADPH:quinone reductase-like Zn-dependent oxidoreductase
MTMQTYVIEKYGGPDGLRVVDRPVPTPGDHDVIVRIRAVSLNYRDLVVLRGVHERNPQPGRIPLSDGAGEVTACGSSVTKFEVGDQVAGCFFQEWASGRFEMAAHRTSLGGPIDGVLAEYVKFSESGLVHFPAGYSFEEGATLPCAAVTAWQALIVRGQLMPGETVLLLGTGGVSIFGLQIAKAAGAKIIITSSQEEKLERAKGLGADHGINYRTTPEWGKEAARLSGTGGVDHVLEVGGGGSFMQSVQACGAGGKIGLIGILGGLEATSEIFPIVPKAATVFGIYVGSREMFEDLNRFLGQSGIRPVIDTVFPFAEAPSAYAHLERGSHFGKVVIRL